MTKPRIPQGTRDFDATVVTRRNYILNIIKNIFELYGYQPLETPAIEQLDTLMGKYGEEGDKLIFKILNNGLDNPSKAETIQKGFAKISEGKSSTNITERALKYDLTIPFARYVAMNFGQLIMPYKRYQIQPVWRADRPQKGRYREFTQCDADVVGSKSLLNEIELTIIYAKVFEKLNVPVQIRMNNRKILAGLASLCGGAEKLSDITIAIDKLDKIGQEGVSKELSERGLSEPQIAIIFSYLQIQGSNAEKIEKLQSLFVDNEIAQQGIRELEFIFTNPAVQQLKTDVVADLTLARGLNYYTGTIFEVKALNVQMGSIGGGGRYDDLTGLFGMPNLPGVGISFGIDRIYDVLTELNLFPADVAKSTQVLFFNLGAKEVEKAFELAEKLRQKGTRCEVFHEMAKFDKQFKYAEKKAIPFVVILGSKELEGGSVNIKKLASGNQEAVLFEDIINYSFI